MLLEFVETLFPPRPKRPYKPIRKPDIPHIGVGLLPELAAIAGDKSHVVAKVVIQANIKPLGIFRRQAIAAAVQRVKLLQPGHNLNVLEKARRYRNLRELKGGFNPISFAIEGAIKLRF